MEVTKMKILQISKFGFQKLPDVEPNEKIYGFQVFLNNWIIELYVSLNNGLNFYWEYDKTFKDLAISFAIFKIGFTNLNNRGV
tara:strand:- start:57 stop:305 length:249 start_codon:yes stop_codon:yes gene_type:complete